MPNIVNTFAQAYKSGAAIRQDIEQRRLEEDTRNTFADVMKKKDEYGGEEGAFREAARRFGESGNINGFNIALQEASGIQAMKEKKRQDAIGMLGSVAVSLYATPENEVQDKYKAAKEWYKSQGIPTDSWPEKYTKELSMSVLGVDKQLKYIDEEIYKKSIAESRKTEAGAKVVQAEAAKTRAAKAAVGGRGAGSKEKHIQVADYITSNKMRNPATGKFYTPAEALEKSKEYVDATKHLTKEDWIRKNVRDMGLKRATDIANQMYGSTESVGAKASDAGIEDWRQYAK